MQQVLFHVPFTDQWFQPDGIPLYGFGAMLFFTFVLTAMVWGPRRVVQVGLPKDKLQDFAILIFLFGIAGARVVYMIQYADQFRGQSKLLAFFQIWNGGIVFYGSVFGGLVGYGLFYWFVMRRFRVSGWKLADAVAPLIALGLAVGRVGCYLNGCCWGQPVCEECQPVPLAPELGKFPLLPAHARDQVVRPASGDDRLPEIHGLQTSTGFAVSPSPAFGVGDPRSVVTGVEPGSAAERAGLQAGDKVVRVNGRPNRAIVEVSGVADAVGPVVEVLTAGGGVAVGKPDSADTRVAFDDPAAYRAAAAKAAAVRPPGVLLTARDSLWETVRDWPRGRGELDLEVERGGQAIPLAFTPRTVPFFPTQIYETVSMVLLTLLLLAFQPFRGRDGEVMVVLMLGYAAHRFLNEAIRIEPTYALNLTLSQWISVAIFAAGVLLWAFLRLRLPALPRGEVPLSYGAPPPDAGPLPAAKPA
ncbi:MAG TPA: prolipoprotein diacylglyceryl transferase family protein [Fimbriiglobus sp.]|nr:prolipoprotein diacylglyceryl transferase family protein [Fimbriiglobus sp.]